MFLFICLQILSKLKRECYLQLTAKAIVVYPNSGEIWDGIAKRWLVSSTYNKYPCTYSITIFRKINKIKSFLTVPDHGYIFSAIGMF